MISNNNALPVGYVVSGKRNFYCIESVIGSGGFGITHRVTTSVDIGGILLHYDKNRPK